MNKKGKHFIENSNKKLKKYKLFLTFFLVLFVYSSVVIIFWINSRYNLYKIEKEVISQVTQENSNVELEYNELGSITVDFNKLNEINTDIKAWIYIKGTNINYPILQTNNNNYYLKHDLYQKYNLCGSIFFDYNAKIFLDDNTIIYGHNLRNDKMFSDLTKIYNGDLGTDIEIEIYTENEFLKFKVLAACLFNGQVLSTIKSNFNIEEKETYIKTNIENSNIQFEDIYSGSKLITLITCDSTGKNRIVVTAIEI